MKYLLRVKESKMLKTVKLKNGSKEGEAFVKVIISILQKLIERDPIALHELVTVARDPSHKTWGQKGKDLEKLTLLEPGGTMHGSVRNIVLSATIGEDLDLQIVNPLA